MSSAESPRLELDGKLLVVAVGQEIAFRVRDRRLFALDVAPRASLRPTSATAATEGG